MYMNLLKLNLLIQLKWDSTMNAMGVYHTT